MSTGLSPASPGMSFLLLYLHGLMLSVELPSVQPGLLSGHDPVVCEQRTLSHVVTPLPSKEIEEQEPGLSPSPATKGLEGPGTSAGHIWARPHPIGVCILHLLKCITVFKSYLFMSINVSFTYLCTGGCQASSHPPCLTKTSSKHSIVWWEDATGPSPQTGTLKVTLLGLRLPHSLRVLSTLRSF